MGDYVQTRHHELERKFDELNDRFRYVEREADKQEEKILGTLADKVAFLESQLEEQAAAHKKAQEHDRDLLKGDINGLQ